ncbi:MAG: ATP-binding protein [Hyphomicrobiales bacterium]|nr:ATP-binding protein [Hyphomicrobiales bacterium]
MIGAETDGRSGGLSRLLMATRRLRRRPALGISASLALFLVAFAVRLALGRFGLASPVPFGIFVPAVLIAPLLGGLPGALVVIVLSGLSAWLLFLPPSYRAADGSAVVVGVTYAVSSLIIIGVMRLLDVEFERLIAERERSEQLYQELQHRIANNLQTVSTILRLQERDVVDAESGQAALRDAGGRLATMGALHRRLYDPKVQTVDVADQLTSLCGEILSATAASNVVCKVEASPGIALPSARALALSLIVNEAVTNALKYAFPAGRDGKILVSLAEDETDYLLEVSDNGVGLSSASPSDGSLGTRIVSSLAAQLGGAPEWRSGSGATFSLRFPR